LVAIVEEARIIRNILKGLHTRYNRAVVEQAAIVGVLNTNITSDPTQAHAAAEYIARRLDALADESERGWSGRFIEGEGFAFERTVRGVKDFAIIDTALLGSAEARRLDGYAKSLQGTYERVTNTFRRKDAETLIHGPASLFEAVMEAGRKGITVQRYKGLGEMNADQLADTTLNLDVRTLLQVKVREVDEADDIFTKLMGEVVEPRREFIQDNALDASIDA
jgi:DNA gyrase subunit B